MTSAGLYNEALRLAQLGYHVLPCWPNKKTPAVRHGVKDATTDETVISNWPANANLAVACNQVFVIDIDSAGHEWRQQHIELLNTAGAVCRTPSGGYHYWFAHVHGAKNAVRVVDGVDVRTTNGYVLVPPSSTEVGQYEWIVQLDVPPDRLPAIPDALRVILFPPARGNGKVRVGQRHAALIRQAGILRARGLGGETLRAAMIEFAAQHLEQPLENEKELHDIVDFVLNKPAGDAPAADLTLQLLRSRLHLWRTRSGDLYIRTGESFAWQRIERGGLVELATNLYCEAQQKVPAVTAMQAAVNAFVSEVKQFHGDPPVRVAVEPTGEPVYDCGAEDQAIILRHDGWQLRRPASQLGRLRPIRPVVPTSHTVDDIWRLRPVCNLRDDQFHLAVGWLVAALLPMRERPLLFLSGPAGSGKSTLASMFAAILDPREETIERMLMAPPARAEDWPAISTTGYVLAFDNLTTIEPWLADTLCRVATGGTIVRRRLYTNTESVVVAPSNPCILTAIDLNLPSDLASRCVELECQPLAGADSKQRLAAVIENDLPLILGGLLTLAAHAWYMSKPTVQTTRFQDFAGLLWAIDRLLGTDALHVYHEAARATQADVAADTDLYAGICVLVRNGPWTGSATALHRDLAMTGYPPHISPKALGRWLIRNYHALPGIRITRYRPHGGARAFRLERVRT